MPTFRCGDEKLCIEMKICVLGQILNMLILVVKLAILNSMETQPQVAI